MLTVKPMVNDARVPANVPLPSMVIDLVIVRVPKLPGSITLISPFIAVFANAPAKVRQGAVRLHGSASLPTPETHVRVAWAWVAVAVIRVRARAKTENESARSAKFGFVMFIVLLSLTER